MSTSSPRGRLLPTGLRVSADLSLQVDGLDVRVEGDGAQLRVLTADATALLARVREAAAAAGLRGGRSRARAVALVAEELAAAGLSVRVQTPGGPLLDAGHGVSSPLGRVALGSSRVRLHRAAALRATGAGRRAGVAAVVLAAAAAAVAAVLRGRRP
ncbi:hypothetical protein ACUN7V_16570 [Quadrisphaera oryzae]|uniref:hypothetical protein n=1 Tax=Quadrisphaera TaxID=317661 RepID=UPI001648EB09|nr:hypothetical protein [Quadrisphaera sp. RL12-1S]MBC3760890.1 hypothetical protein [Quadrisphaera sp. RL12-1S]